MTSPETPLSHDPYLAHKTDTLRVDDPRALFRPKPRSDSLHSSDTSRDMWRKPDTPPGGEIRDFIQRKPDLLVPKQGSSGPKISDGIPKSDSMYLQKADTLPRSESRDINLGQLLEERRRGLDDSDEGDSETDSNDSLEGEFMLAKDQSPSPQPSPQPSIRSRALSVPVLKTSVFEGDEEDEDDSDEGTRL